ncbi:serine acetyltransferase [Halobacillus salinus]|uniref:Serine acetyltransferase n=1 Tax=Halobacillus salinus TaxID=192814 RepID=A0A4Z0GXH2_9BACI|nr:serine acetyltransferase [Halobacillus salinus]
MYNIYLKKYSSYIGHNAKIANPPCFPHDKFGIFISGNASIGKDCIIFQQVTIGTNHLPDSKGMGAPTIGNNCYIGAGAKIIGKVVVGNNVRIGANCVVFEDVPDNSVVVNEKPRYIQKNEITNKQYKRIDGKWKFYNNGLWEEELDEEVLNKLNEI